MSLDSKTRLGLHQSFCYIYVNRKKRLNYSACMCISKKDIPDSYAYSITLTHTSVRECTRQTDISLSSSTCVSSFTMSTIVWTICIVTSQNIVVLGTRCSIPIFTYLLNINKLFYKENIMSLQCCNVDTKCLSPLKL